MDVRTSLTNALTQLSWPPASRRSVQELKSQIAGARTRLIGLERSTLSARLAARTAGTRTDSDQVWRALAEKDPYWAVISRPQNRQVLFDEAARANFFADGDEWVAGQLATIAARFAVEPAALTTALDFGCGVGRLTAALARRGMFVTGVDVSERMLELARENLTAFGLEAQLMLADENLDVLPRDCFDLCISTIVFQHIDPRRGLETFRRLFESVRPGGFMSHFFLFSTDHRGGPVRIGTGVEQEIQMNEYDMTDLMSVCEEFSSDVYIRLTRHGPHKAATVVAQRRVGQPEDFGPEG